MKELVTRELKDLDPTEYENFIYDVAIVHGFKNVVWRTPGPDGGRDIEATYSRINPFGDVVTEKWYIECKKYKTSVSWPIIYPKIAYAHSGGADILCIAAFPNPSPNCETEISKWNKINVHPKITTIRPYALKFDTPMMNKIGVKFRIIEPSIQSIPIELIKLSANLAEQANSVALIGLSAEAYLDAAAKFSWLSRALSDREYELNADGAKYRANSDGESWIENDQDLELPSDIVRALASLMRVVSQAGRISLATDGNQIVFASDQMRIPLTHLEGALREVAVMANLELTLSDNSIAVRRRSI